MRIGTSQASVMSIIRRAEAEYNSNAVPLLSKTASQMRGVVLDAFPRQGSRLCASTAGYPRVRHRPGTARQESLILGQISRDHHLIGVRWNRSRTVLLGVSR